MADKIERPKLPSPVKIGGGGAGKIIVKVSGRNKVVAGKADIVIERIE